MASKIKRDILNQSANNVPNRKMSPKFITVHNTANASKGANAEMHARYQRNGSGGRGASWHYTVDDKEAWQSLEDNQQGWHAGDGQGKGNTQSIGIEICENSDGDFDKAVANAQELIRNLMDKHGISLANVVTHKHWSGKNCPRLLLDSWDEFKAGIKGGSNSSKPTQTKPKPSKPKTKSIAQMADEVIAGKHGQGHANRKKSLGITIDKYAEVRAEVNKRVGVGTTSKPKKPAKSVSQMASEVIAGKHGNGIEHRRKSLGVNKATYAEVQAEVNKRVKGANTSKSVTQMASEVIAGKHGNGHAKRRSSLGVSKAAYERVRKEVNRRT